MNVTSRARLGTAVVFALNGFGHGSWAPRLAEVKDGLGLGEGQLGIALFMLAIGALIAMPLAGILIARFGSRAVTAAAILPFALSLAALALAGGWASLCAAFFAYGVSSGSMDVAMNAQGAAVERRRRRPILSSLHGMFSLGGMAGAVVAGWVAREGAGLAPHFAWVGAASLIVGFAACLWMLGPKEDARADGPLFVRPSRGLLLLGVIAFCVLLAEGSVGDWSAVYLSGSLGADTATAAAAFAVFSLMMAAGRFAGDRLILRFGEVRIIRVGGALAALGLGGALLIGRPEAAILGFGMVGAGLSCIFPVTLSLAARAGDVPAGVAIAGVCTLGYFGLLLGPPLIGVLAELMGLPPALGLVVLLCVIVTVLGRAVRRPNPTS